MSTIAPTRPAEYSNGLGTAGLVMGIIGLVACLTPIIGLFCAPLALIALGLSIAGLVKTRRGSASNFGSALAGALMGGAGLAAAGFWLLLTLAAAASSAEADGVSLDAAVDSTHAIPAATKMKSISGAGKVVKVGTPLKVEDFSGMASATIVIDRVQKDAQPDNEFREAARGNHFMAAHFVVQNTSSKPYSNVTWFGTKAYVASGQSYEADPLSGTTAGRALPSTIDLKPEGKVGGWILFEVPTDEKVDSIAFDDAEWKL